MLAALVLAYAYPVRTYLTQQAEIDRIKQEIAAGQQGSDALAKQRAKWDDPAFVKAQARARLHYHFPGEKPYIVIDDPAGAARDKGEKPPPTKAAKGPWYGKLWSSVSDSARK